MKFGFLVKHSATFLIVFSVSVFKMEFTPLPDLPNTGLTIIEIGLFYGGEHLEAKICRFQNFFEQHWPCLSRTTISEDTLNTGWVFLIFIKTLNLLPNGLLMNSKTGNLLNFLPFVKFLWMLSYLPENYFLTTCSRKFFFSS